MLPLSTFERTRFDQLGEAIEEANLERVRALAAAVKEEFVPVHDGFVDASASTLSRLVDLTSPEEGEAIGREAMQRHMKGEWFVQYIGEHDPSPDALRERIRSIVTTWHWHPSLLTVTEDDERVTIHSHPCGSGMRLELRGKYDGPQAWHRSVTPSASNFMERGFPMYCNHCPEMNRAGLSRGVTTWLVEGWRPYRAPERLACRQHAYKRLEDVPPEFYRRVGLEPAAAEKPRSRDRAERLFTDEELAELSTHPCDRLVAIAEQGDTERGLAALAACREGWAGMHDAYPIWLAILWDEVERRFGHEELLATVAATAPELIANVPFDAPEKWASFWSMHLGLEEVTSERNRLEFSVRADALISQAAPATVEEFCAALDQGAQERGWNAVGRFEAQGETVIHRLT